MMRASLLNQARVHFGYHYPRSLLTARRARVNYDRFASDYASCVVDSFPHYYAIARHSRVTARQFGQFCARIGAHPQPAPAGVRRLFSDELIEQVVVVREGVFDANRLREVIERQLADAGVRFLPRTHVARVQAAGAGLVALDYNGTVIAQASLIVNATYAAMNSVLRASHAATMPLKHELAELVVIEAPPELARAAVTVVDGPYFSLVPYPPARAHTLSHVRFTPHATWYSGIGAADDASAAAARPSRAGHMLRDAQRYLPCLAKARPLDSIWEIKTLMPRSEHDDSRPILFRESAELPGLISVLGAKIDSVYDVEDALEAWLRARPVPVT